MIKIYSMPSCPDCRNVEEQIAGLDGYEVIDIGSHVRLLKEFLRLRDSNPAFDDARRGGYIGIPCFVLEDGRVTLKPEEAGLKANISVPEPRMIVIQPWEKPMLREIEKAITKSDLGLNPNSDGSVIRLNIPQLTEERRKDLVKTLNKRAEESKVAVRNIRRDANDAIKKLEKAKSITEDEAKKGQEDVQKIVDKYIKEIDAARADKEKEIMEV